MHERVLAGKQQGKKEENVCRRQCRARQMLFTEGKIGLIVEAYLSVWGY